MNNVSSRRLAAAGIGAACALFASSPAAQVFGGVTFPGGVSSFADAVTVYAPTIVANQPGLSFRNGDAAIGAPDIASGGDCSTPAVCPYVSLGDGGAITLEFIDNRLTGSGDAKLDLWIFEIGPDVEDTFVAISRDGVQFFNVGKVFGATSGIDVDAFGFGTADRFRFVRLIDDTNVLGSVRVTKALLGSLRASGDGHVVVIGSIAAMDPYPGGGGYNAAKFGERAFAQVLRQELLGEPIRVTEIDPGMVETEFSTVRFGGDDARAAKVYAGMTPLTADDVADAVAWSVTRPSHVNVDQLVLMARDQYGARTVHRTT